MNKKRIITFIICAIELIGGIISYSFILKDLGWETLTMAVIIMVVIGITITISKLSDK